MEACRTCPTTVARLVCMPPAMPARCLAVCVIRLAQDADHRKPPSAPPEPAHWVQPQLTNQTTRHTPGHRRAQHQCQRQRRKHGTQKAAGFVHGTLVGGLDVLLFEVNQAVNRSQPLHILRLGLAPEQVYRSRIAIAHLFKDGSGGCYRLAFSPLNIGIKGKTSLLTPGSLSKASKDCADWA